MFTFVKSVKNGVFSPKTYLTMEMKDRIKDLMESQHMTQQSFANFLDLSPASLSSIFNGRTKPTLNIVEAIHKKFPNVSLNWLMFGVGSMEETVDNSKDNSNSNPSPSSSEPTLNFDVPTSTPSSRPMPDFASLNTIKAPEKIQRKITEIRIFYDDQTWESFVPKK